MRTTAVMLGRAAAERLSGGRPGVLRALAAATLTGGATGAVTYRLLRSRPED